MSRLRFSIIPLDATPPEGTVSLYARDDRNLYLKDDAGNEYKLITSQEAGFEVRRVTYTLTEEDVVRQYFELEEIPMVNSLTISHERVLLFEGDDYQVETINGRCRIYLIGSIAEAGLEALEEGSKIQIKYFL